MSFEKPFYNTQNQIKAANAILQMIAELLGIEVGYSPKSDSFILYFKTSQECPVCDGAGYFDIGEEKDGEFQSIALKECTICEGENFKFAYTLSLNQETLYEYIRNKFGPRNYTKDRKGLPFSIE